MKKKSLFKAGLGALAVGLGVVSSPSTQQVMEQTMQNGTTVQQQAPQRYLNNNGQQQAQNNQGQQYRSNAAMNPYAPLGGGALL